MNETLKLPKLSAIVATARNRTIGRNNTLPWKLPADLQHFKAITTGHTILMGRKTYQSIGRALPNRTNIVLTRDATFSAPGIVAVTSIDEAFNKTSGEIFIIGGAEIYQQLLPRVEKIYLTLIHHDIEGDAYFPELNNDEWKEIAREEHHADAMNEYDYSFIELARHTK